MADIDITQSHRIVDPITMTQPALLFDNAGRNATRLQHRRRRSLVAVLVIVVVAIGVVVATKSGASTGSANRTATVGVHPVQQLLNGVGTVEPLTQATVGFPTSGTVASVDVAVGDSVSVGESLATLSPTSLTNSLNEAQATAAKAALNLSKALAGQPVTGATGAGSRGGSPTGSGATTSGAAYSMTTPTANIETVAYPTPGTSGTTTSGTSNSAALAAAQQLVLSAQMTVDANLAAASQALATAAQVCSGVVTPTSTATPATATPVSSTSTSLAPTTTVPQAPTASALAACQQALGQVLTAQHTTATSQAALSQAAASLDGLISQSASPSTGANGSSLSNATGSSPSSSKSTSTGTAASTASAPSAAQLIAYQQAVDAANAGVAVAQQSLDGATIVSPIAGTVVAVNLTAGTSASSGSSTSNVVIAGVGGMEVTTMVSVTSLPHVKVGQDASVLPDGARSAITGRVVSIGLSATTTSSTTVYPVAISLTGNTQNLANGSTASVAIVTGRATNSLAVPTSAVTTNGSQHSVTVVDGSTLTVEAVSIGAVGSPWIQVTGGLRSGQKVLLANLSTPLPGSATSSTNGSTNSSTANPAAEFARFAGARGTGGTPGRNGTGGG